MTIKLLKNLLYFAALLCAISLTSCGDDDPVEPEKSIVTIAGETADLSTLVAALQQANLVSALEADGPFTVFAPTNAAFQALLDSNDNWNTLSDIPAATLDAVLKYHVVSGTAAKSTDLSDGQVIGTLNGENITVDLSNGVNITTIAEQSVGVTTADVEASNGVVHFVDEVMLPFAPATPDITELAIATPDLSTLVAALQQTNLVGALQADGPFTVFAPTNAAFQDLLDSNPAWNQLSDIPNDVLSNVLLFHVTSGKITSGDLSDTYVNTLSMANGEMVSLQVNTTGGVSFNGGAAPVTVDVEGSNGIVHIIDKVMLPPNVVNLAANNSNFSILVAALTDSRHTTDFLGVLNGAGPFTVFAPTDAAFQALLDSNPDWNGLGDIPIETLDAVLKYHVVSGANVQSDELTDGQMVEMLNGGMTTIDLSNGAKIKTGSDQIVDIIITNVQGTNGVIHAIDTVLLP